MNNTLKMVSLITMVMNKGGSKRDQIKDTEKKKKEQRKESVKHIKGNLKTKK